MQKGAPEIRGAFLRVWSGPSGLRWQTSQSRWQVAYLQSQTSQSRPEVACLRSQTSQSRLQVACLRSQTSQSGEEVQVSVGKYEFDHMDFECRGAKGICLWRDVPKMGLRLKVTLLEMSLCLTQCNRWRLVRLRCRALRPTAGTSPPRASSVSPPGRAARTSPLPRPR